MSATDISGLVGVSTQTATVSPGRIAASTAARSVRSTGSVINPHGSYARANSRKEPPYASCGSTRCAPGFAIERIKVSSAASPLAKANPREPPSRAARHSSSAVRVGLAEREYSYPFRSPPTPSWAKVEEATIGGITAPVVGSGSWPAWMARVEKPGRSTMSVSVRGAARARRGARRAR